VKQNSIDMYVGEENNSSMYQLTWV